MAKTGIEWTDETWNPVRGCDKISPGCKNCYAAVFAERWRGIKNHPYEQGFDLRLVPDKLTEPMQRKKPTKFFVNSMSDLFHEGVPRYYLLKVWETMRDTPQHTYQILTKRAQRMRDEVNHLFEIFGVLPNVWLGVSVEDQKYGLPRIDYLRHVPAKVRFLSIEPLLEDLGSVRWDGIHLAIVGGESGNGARAMQAEWVRNLRDQCLVNEVKFFFKQWGGVKKKVNGRLLDGRTWDELPFQEATQ